MNKDRDALLSLLREARNYLDANLPTNIYAVRREGLGLLDRIDSALAAPAESEGALSCEDAAVLSEVVKRAVGVRDYLTDAERDALYAKLQAIAEAALPTAPGEV